jgi:alanine racemase
MQKSVRPTWAEIDLAAIAKNVETVRSFVAPAEVCAVVKAFGYGHGLVRVAEAAITAGATSAGVALVEEGRALRQAGIDEPILVLSEPLPTAMDELVQFGLTPSVYSLDGVESLGGAVERARVSDYPVHVKIDTGMNRVGVSPADALDVVRAVEKHKRLKLQGVFTHFSVADEPQNQYTKKQLERFQRLLDLFEHENISIPVRHAANSAAALAFPESHFDMVRLGIAMYGIAPSLELAGIVPLQPAMSLKTRVTFVKRIGPNEPISYGMRYRTSKESTIATAPIGYADGLNRALGIQRADVLIGGQRHNIAGTVTMDQVVVDCDNSEIAIGDEVVLLGRQGNEEISAWEWAHHLNDIAWTVVCGVSSRVPRRYLPD